MGVRLVTAWEYGRFHMGGKMKKVKRRYPRYMTDCRNCI